MHIWFMGDRLCVEGLRCEAQWKRGVYIDEAAYFKNGTGQRTYSGSR